ncbi:hypothetical protein WJX73_003833 [Symbiochloris irregularis]|uniref:Uncharacterized protein n=1 Tax=Symbiochloris irregularis TaxID=706552 RepID=A0AAW1PHY0_9CHLO
MIGKCKPAATSKQEWLDIWRLPEESSIPEQSKSKATLFWSAAVVITGILNRIFYKMTLQPMRNYVIVLAQFQTFIYTVVYFSILFLKYKSGKVTKAEITNNNKRCLLAIGFTEAAALILGLMGAAMLPGVILPLLQQSYLLWQILVNKLLLGKGLRPVEYLGASMVGAGVCFSAWPSKSGSAFAKASPVGITLFTVSLFLLVFDTLAKEQVFDEGEERHKRPLDVFVVNSFGSAYQAIFVALLLPFYAAFKGIGLKQLPHYLMQGLRALMGMQPACGTDCSASPQLAATYILMNLCYNVSVLSLLRTAGNVPMSLASSVLIPLTIWAFTWPWPYLDPTPALGTHFLIGASIMMSGLFVFNAPLWRPLLSRSDRGQQEVLP